FGVAPISEQRPGEPRQAREVIMDVDRAIARDTPQLREIPRKRVRKDRLALDQPAIAVGGFLTRLPSVDQHDLLPALLQLHGDRYADHTRAKNQHIRLHQTRGLRPETQDFLLTPG